MHTWLQCLGETDGKSSHCKAGIRRIGAGHRSCVQRCSEIHLLPCHVLVFGVVRFVSFASIIPQSQRKNHRKTKKNSRSLRSCENWEPNLWHLITTCSNWELCALMSRDLPQQNCYELLCFATFLVDFLDFLELFENFLAEFGWMLWVLLELLRIRRDSTSESLKGMLHGMSLSSLSEELLGKPLNKDGWHFWLDGSWDSSPRRVLSSRCFLDKCP